MPLDLPTHADYSRILQAIADGDDAIEAAGMTAASVDLAQLSSTFGHLVDVYSMYHSAICRCEHMAATAPPAMMILAPEAVLCSAWSDGFLSGVRFQQSGGHR